MHRSKSLYSTLRNKVLLTDRIPSKFPRPRGGSGSCSRDPGNGAGSTWPWGRAVHLVVCGAWLPSLWPTSLCPSCFQKHVGVSAYFLCQVSSLLPFLPCQNLLLNWWGVRRGEELSAWLQIGLLLFSAQPALGCQFGPHEQLVCVFGTPTGLLSLFSSLF